MPSSASRSFHSLLPLPFLLLLSAVRQRTSKKAVAAGLFAVLCRKRGTVSGQVREEPDQLGCLGSSTRLLPRCCLVFPVFVRQQQTRSLPTRSGEPVWGHFKRAKH